MGHRWSVDPDKEPDKTNRSATRSGLPPGIGPLAQCASVKIPVVPRSSWTRRAEVWLGALIAVAVAAPGAHGDLALCFRVPVAHPGQTVVAFLGDSRGHLERLKSLRPRIHTYLVPARDRISPSHQTRTGPPTSSAWISLGPLRKARDGSVKMRFRLPADLAPGLYTIGFWCIPCAPPDGGHVYRGLPELDVEARRQVPDSCARRCVEIRRRPRGAESLGDRSPCGRRGHSGSRRAPLPQAACRAA